MCQSVVSTSSLSALGDKGVERGTLYVVSTPIGNVHDMSPRAVEVLVRSDIVLAEDTRRARRLLAALGVTPEGRLRAYHEYSRSTETTRILDEMAAGASAALISDAGTPLISDPGAALVRACARVVPVPGCSAAVTALVGSGLPAIPHTFLGFLPDASEARRRRLELFSSTGATLVVFVPPHDLVDVLEDAAAVLGEQRRCCIAREMTKAHEEFWRGDLRGAVEEILAHGAGDADEDSKGGGAESDGEVDAAAAAAAGSFHMVRHRKQRQQWLRRNRKQQQRFRGEIVLVIDGASALEADAGLMPTTKELKAHIKALMITSQGEDRVGRYAVPVKQIVSDVVSELGVRKKLAYKLALEVQLEDAEERGYPGGEV